MNPIQTEKIKDRITDKLAAHFGKTTENASESEIFSTCAILLREMIAKNKVENEKEDERHLHYLSLEFLMGRSLAKNAFNLGIYEELWGALEELGFSASDVFESEPDAGLGNGGLGRLAACYADSMASLDLPVTGYSLCYELGMFRQKIVAGKQIELADDWQTSADSWLVPCYEDSIEVRFGGRVEENWDYQGRCTTNIKDYTSVLAVPRDMLISGYKSDRVNTLRLWEAKSPKAMDMSLFKGGEYVKSMEQRTMAEVITKVLYPPDDTLAGKTLRLKQQYFFVSATAQSIVNKHREKYGTVHNFADHHVFQINDTHPTLIIPELMRIFMDTDGLGWDEAAQIVATSVAYTNHTVMLEALECWPQDLVKDLLPRIWQIILEIDKRHRRYLNEQLHGDETAILRNLIISDGTVKMANICVAVGYMVNGVSALHSEILKNDLFRDMYKLQPTKFTNVTNGIDHRRWLTQSNPQLHKFIVSHLGNDDYLKQPQKLSELEKFVNDTNSLNELEQIKLNNKKRFADYIKKTQGFNLNTDAIFDVQVKRLHEYKRQLMCAMLITHLVQRIQDNPQKPFTPRTFIFGAKAASSYYVAKRIISLLCSLSNYIKNEPLCNGKIQLVFVENYRVSVAEKLMPAAQVSEQISTAGKEASGTGNMKLMMNGAITIGTLDGANVEMYDYLGDENMVLFGLRADEVETRKRQGYYPADIYLTNDRIHRILNRFSRGFNDGDTYSDLVSKLVYGGDEYMLLADFDSYIEAHDRLYDKISDTQARAKMSLTNIARSGTFAADRAVSQYNKKIWHLT